MPVTSGLLLAFVAVCGLVPVGGFGGKAPVGLGVVLDGLVVVVPDGLGVVPVDLGVVPVGLGVVPVGFGMVGVGLDPGVPADPDF